jgi:hypothetical protein
MHERKPDFLADRVIAPDLAHEDLVVIREPPSDVDHTRRDVQMESCPDSREVRPLRQRLEVVDRLACFDFNDDLEAMTALGR